MSQSLWTDCRAVYYEDRIRQGLPGALLPKRAVKDTHPPT